MCVLCVCVVCVFVCVVCVCVCVQDPSGKLMMLPSDLVLIQGDSDR